MLMRKLVWLVYLTINIYSCKNPDVKLSKKDNTNAQKPLSDKQETKLAAIDSIVNAIDADKNLYLEIDSAVIKNDIFHYITYEEMYERKRKL